MRFTATHPPTLVDTAPAAGDHATPAELEQVRAAARASYAAGAFSSAPAMSQVWCDLIAGHPVGENRTRELADAYVGAWRHLADLDAAALLR